MARGWVYLFTADGGNFKIGQSVNPRSRLGDFLSLPFNIKLLHQIAATNMDIAEEFLHSLFAAKRVCGEWFKLSDEDVKWIKNILIFDDFDMTFIFRCPSGCGSMCESGGVGCCHAINPSSLCDLCSRFVDWRVKRGREYNLANGYDEKGEPIEVPKSETASG